MFFFKSANNYAMNVLDTPRLWQQFNIKIVANKLNNVGPLNNGTLGTSSNLSCPKFMVAYDPSLLTIVNMSFSNSWVVIGCPLRSHPLKA
jgi:hypothetical protein